MFTKKIAAVGLFLIAPCWFGVKCEAGFPIGLPNLFLCVDEPAIRPGFTASQFDNDGPRHSVVRDYGRLGCKDCA